MAIRRVTRAGVGLAIGIIILAVLVFGSLWFVRERGEQARRTEAINIADQQLKAESNQGIALNPDNTTANPNSSSESSSPSTNDSSSNAQSNGSTAANGSSNSTATELPKTGATENAVIVIGLLAFASFSYLNSRKLVFKKL